MYTLHEAAEYLGKSYNSVLRMAIRKNIERTKKGRYTYIKESDLEKLGKRQYYKVSIYDNNSCNFFVKICSLTKKRAEEFVKSYEAIGVVARASLH